MSRLPHVCRKFLARQFSISRSDRNYSWPKPDYGPKEVMRSELMNGIKVASAKPLGAQIAACTIMYQAGSRYEADECIGVSHFMRAMSGASGCGYTSFLKGRYLAQCGASLSCSSDRQSIAFTLRCPVTTFSELKNYLIDAAARCCYHAWEVEDSKQLVRDDLERITPEQRVMDLIHMAAFRGPLSNSVFCPRGRIDSMDKDKLVDFALNNFITVRCSVGSVGVPFEETVKMAAMIEQRRERPCNPSTAVSFPKAGYEYYDLGAGSDTWIALAVPATGSCDISCVLKHAIIAASCGTGHMQEGQHDLDRTPQPPLGSLAQDVYTQYKAFSISYSDQGIFGILVKTRAATAQQAAACAAQFLTNVGDLTYKQIATGKRRLKVSMSLHDEDCVKVSEGLALQIANNLQIDGARSSMAMIDLIPADEVCVVAKALSNKYLRFANIQTALNAIKECHPRRIPVEKTYFMSKAKTLSFAPRSIGVEITDNRIVERIRQDPIPYIPIINPRSILPLIDNNRRKDEIGLPTEGKDEIQAARLIVIRRKKMKKHQRRKLWKRMRHRWARVKQRRRIVKEKIFQNQLLAMVKEANEFSAEQYVSEKLDKANHTPLPTRWRHKRLPEFIIRQLLGIDKKINYKHTDKYKA